MYWGSLEVRVNDRISKHTMNADGRLMPNQFLPTPGRSQARCGANVSFGRVHIVLAIFLAQANGQTQPTTRPAPPSPYIAHTSVPSNVREYLLALGDRIQEAGKERLTLAGSITDGQNKV